MRVVITGASGQLGKELCETLACYGMCEVVGLDHKELDISDWETVITTIEKIRPTHIINTAAYTNVDGCETDASQAYLINYIGPMYLARAAKHVDATIIHISTDFVFDGLKKDPYFEYDATVPVSIYGKSKLAGEVAIKNECAKHYIFRTSWLYGKYGQNFVKTMLSLSQVRDNLEIVNDQVGSPTYVVDLVLLVCKALKVDYYGTYHFSNSGNCSWFEFAHEIFRVVEKDVHLIPISSEKLNRLATRPKFSVLDTTMTSAIFGMNIRTWNEALKDFLLIKTNN